MEYKVRDIAASEFKQYIMAMKACRPGPHYELEGKYGMLHLNFGETSANRAVVTLKRKSGNGVGVIVSGPNLTNIHVTSKVRHIVNVPLHQSKDLFIKRTQRSNGNLDVIKVELFGDKEEVEINWSEILKSCSSHTCLRTVGGKLFASEGATIVAEEIGLVETNPPNMYSINGNKIRFLRSCEVVKLEAQSKKTVGKKPPEQLVHMQEEPAVLKKADEKTDVQPQNTNRIKRTPEKKAEMSSSLLAFDSAASGFTRSFVNNDVVVHPKHMVLGHRGEYRMPIRSLEAGRGAIITVEAANMRGNGRFVATITPSDDAKNRPIVTSNHKQRFEKRIVAAKTDDIHYLVVGRNQCCTGDMMITRITVVMDPYMKPESVDVVRRYVTNSDASIVGNVQNIDDPVLLKSLKHAAHSSTWEGKDKLDFDSHFSTTSYSGLNWFHRVSPIIPNVHLGGNQVKMTMQVAGSIKSFGKRVFVEECYPDSLTKDDLKALRHFDQIITPSAQVQEFLQSDMPNATVTLGYKPWPLTQAKQGVPVPKDYILVFNRDPVITKRVIDAHKDDMPKLVVVGARGGYPAKVLPTNEYLPYPNLLHLIENAKTIVDIPYCYEYDSGLFRLCMAYGKPTITSNWKAIEHTESAIYIMPDDKHLNGKIPGTDAIREALEDSVNKGPAPDTLEGYVLEFNEAMGVIFG